MIRASIFVTILGLLAPRAASFRPTGRLVRTATTVSFPGVDSIVGLQGRVNDIKALQALPATGEDEESEGFDIKAWFNPNTRGGVIVWSFLLLAFPIGIYNYLVSTGLEDTKVGGYVGAIFVLLSNLLWASTYIFRVANKDMTYAKQLRDYENAVLQKRLEELADDEIEALMSEIEAEDDKPGGSKTTD